MFRLFFDTVQSVLGESLATVASILHVAAMVLLVGVWLLPPLMWRVRRWRSMHGISEGTVMHCWNCGYAGLPHGLSCRRCGRELQVPALLRLSLRLQEWRSGRLASRTAAVYHSFGLVWFYAFTALFAVKMDLFRPGPDLRKIFIATGTIALVWSCILFRRTFSLYAPGLLRRFSNLFFGLSTLGFVFFFLFVASATATVEAHYLGKLRHTGSEVTFNTLRVAAMGKEIGIEYLQIGQDKLGYHHIFLLALEGDERVSVERDPLTRALLSHLARTTDPYERLGFDVRVRVERRALTVGVPYAVYSSGQEIYIRRQDAR